MTEIEIIVYYSYKYQVSKQSVEQLIQDGKESGMSLKQIEIYLKYEFSKRYGTNELLTIEEVGILFDLTKEEVTEIIEDSIEEIKATGGDPSEYFVTIKGNGLN
jgi:hypothetical protein